jgi:predicted metal-dependent phosphoesterase TrpH
MLLVSFQHILFAQDHSHRLDRSLKFPDVPGFKTMKCDFHQHTVFSDGSVWPDIRVMEALIDGLDAISLTEHLEYQPHKEDIPHPNRNRSYELALKEAKNHNLIIVNGSEITRKMPPGHNNAIFIQDANALLVKDSVEVFRVAKQQGAFTFWNHPNWINQRKDGVATLTDMHRFLIKEKLLDGIEVVNQETYSEEALQIALDYDLTIMGTSDIHSLIDWEFKVDKGGHRPITLVFATDRTQEAIKEGLLQRRTVVYYKDQLIGRVEHLLPLLQSGLTFKSMGYQGKSNVLNVVLTNNTSCPLTVRNISRYKFHDQGEVFTIPANGEVSVQVKTIDRLKEVVLNFEILNAITAPGKHANISLSTSL